MFPKRILEIGETMLLIVTTREVKSTGIQWLEDSEYLAIHSMEPYNKKIGPNTSIAIIYKYEMSES
jgi:hypothetical protein